MRAIAAAALALAATAPSAASAASIPAPDSDPFYVPPPSLDSYAPGTVLRSRQVPVIGLTQGASNTAYQLLYRTNDAKDQPIATATTLLLPSVPSAGSRKLVSYQTAEDSLTTKCAPSYTLQTGSGSTQNAESLEMGLLLAQGWDVAVPDYQGPKSEWAVGPLEGRTTLDSIRAVESFAPASLAGPSTPAAMMGYSGGAIPSVWANALSSSYAPELKIVGVAAGGIAANPIENLDAVDGTVFAGAIVGVSVAADRAYPELGLDSVLNDKGKALAKRDAEDADGCAGSVTNAPFGRVSDLTNYPSPQALEAVPQVQSVFAHLNLIKGPVPTAPSYFYNAINDELAIIKPVDELVAADCAQGATIDYYRDPLGEHLTGAGAYVPPALLYLEDRFAGKPAPNTCAPTRARANSPPTRSAGAQPANGPSCTATRRLRFRLRAGPHQRIVRADVYVDGRRVKTMRGRRLTHLALPMPSPGSHTVKIVARSARGVRRTIVRHYASC